MPDHRLELAPVDNDGAAHEQAHVPAQSYEARADLADRRAILLPEVGDRLVVGNKPAEEPHQLDVAPGLALQPPARLHTVEIAVDVELQQNCRVVGGPARRLGDRPGKAQRSQIKRFDEGLDHMGWVVLIDPVVQALVCFGVQV